MKKVKLEIFAENSCFKKLTLELKRVFIAAHLGCTGYAIYDKMLAFTRLINGLKKTISLYRIKVIIIVIIIITIIIMIIIIIVIIIIMKIIQGKSLTQEIQCSYFGIVLSKT